MAINSALALVISAFVAGNPQWIEHKGAKVNFPNTKTCAQAVTEMMYKFSPVVSKQANVLTAGNIPSKMGANQYDIVVDCSKQSATVVVIENDRLFDEFLAKYVADQLKKKLEKH